MSSLRELSLECTQFDGEDILNLLKEIKNPYQLKELSIRYLNGE